MLPDPFRRSTTTVLPHWVKTALGMGLLILVATLVGCGESATVEETRRAEPTPVPAPAGVSADGQELSLEVVDAGSLTGLITDHRGFVVYGNANESTDVLVCIDECTDVWVPLTPRDNAIASGLDATKFRVITRPDGGDQVVYDDVALYLWTGDTDIGITRGAGVAGTWFALLADGTRVR